MRYWFDTSGTIARGLGFSLFDAEHLFWLALTVFFLTAVCRYYRASELRRRTRLRHTMAAAIVANEIFKTAMLVLGGNWEPEYLPLHLCSVNVFLVAYHAWKPGKLLDNFLYAVCVPGAAAALLFPSWNKLPPINFMYLHSFTIHILLVLYPLLLVTTGQAQTDLKSALKGVGLLVVMAIPVYGLNLLWGTNFMFLMEPDSGNPLELFEELLGSHLWGFPILLPSMT